MVTDEPRHLASELLPLFERGGTRHFPEQGLDIGYPYPKLPNKERDSLSTTLLLSLVVKDTVQTKESQEGALVHADTPLLSTYARLASSSYLPKATLNV